MYSSNKLLFTIVLLLQFLYLPSLQKIYFSVVGCRTVAGIGDRPVGERMGIVPLVVVAFLKSC